MIGPVGTAVINEVLKELKLNNEQDALVNRQQANDQFDQKIAELRSQVQILKDQAAKIGKMGIFSFVIGLVTTAVNFALASVAPLKTVAAKFASKLLGAVSGALLAGQTLLNNIAEKGKAKSQAKVKQSEVSAELFEKFYNDYHAEEQEAAKRASDVLQTMREVRQEIAEGNSSMAKI